MPNRIAYQPDDFCFLIDSIYSINFTEFPSRQLSRGRGTLIIESAVGKKRPARRTENSSHNSRLTHRDRNHLVAFPLSASQQMKDRNAVRRIVSSDCDFQDSRGPSGHALVDLIKIGGDTTEIMMRADHTTPVDRGLLGVKALHEIEFQIHQITTGKLLVQRNPKTMASFVIRRSPPT